jgi:hypothetical protein
MSTFEIVAIEIKDFFPNFYIYFPDEKIMGWFVLQIAPEVSSLGGRNIVRYKLFNGSDVSFDMVVYHIGNHIICGDSDFDVEVNKMKKEIAKSKLSGEQNLKEKQLEGYTLKKMDIFSKNFYTVSGKDVIAVQKEFYFVLKNAYPTEKYVEMGKNNWYLINACERFQFSIKELKWGGNYYNLGKDNNNLTKCCILYKGQFKTITAVLKVLFPLNKTRIVAIYLHEDELSIMVHQNGNYTLHRFDVRKELSNAEKQSFTKEEMIAHLKKIDKVSYMSSIEFLEF